MYASLSAFYFLVDPTDLLPVLFARHSSCPPVGFVHLPVVHHFCLSGIQVVHRSALSAHRLFTVPCNPSYRLSTDYVCPVSQLFTGPLCSPTGCPLILFVGLPVCPTFLYVLPSGLSADSVCLPFRFVCWFKLTANCCMPVSFTPSYRLSVHFVCPPVAKRQLMVSTLAIPTKKTPSFLRLKKAQRMSDGTSQSSGPVAFFLCLSHFSSFKIVHFL